VGQQELNPNLEKGWDFFICNSSLNAFVGPRDRGWQNTRPIGFVSVVSPFILNPNLEKGWDFFICNSSLNAFVGSRDRGWQNTRPIGFLFLSFPLYFKSQS